MRLSKLAQTVQPHVTVLQALHIRYQGTALDPAADSSMTLGGSSARGRVLVALVGQEEVLQKQGRLHNLVKAALIDSCVSSAVRPTAVPAPVGITPVIRATERLKARWWMCTQTSRRVTLMLMVTEGTGRGNASRSA